MNFIFKVFISFGFFFLILNFETSGSIYINFTSTGLKNYLDLTKNSNHPSLTHQRLKCIDQRGIMPGPGNYFDSSEFSTQPSSTQRGSTVLQILYTMFIIIHLYLNKLILRIRLFKYVNS